MAPRKNNFIPDMRETRYRSQSFANPYAPAAPKPFNFATANKIKPTVSASTGFRTPQNLDPNRNIGGTYYKTRSGFELSKNGQTLWKNDQWYRPRDPKESFGPINFDSRPSWMSQQDLANKNRATYGSAVPSFGQLTYETVGVGYDRSGKFGVDPVNLGVGIALAGSGKLFRGALGAVEKYQGAKLATKLAQFDAEIIANRTAIRAAGRAAAEVRQTARRARKSTNVRAARLLRVEKALEDSNPALAQRMGDRGYAASLGDDLSRVMAQSDTVGTGRRFRLGRTKVVGSGKKARIETEKIPTGARSFPNDDSKLAGSHHSYTPLSEAQPAGVLMYPVQGVTRGSNDAFEWLNRTANAYDSYGRTGMERLSGMYSGGVPKGGWSRRPNLRKNNPLPPRWGGDDMKTRVINLGEMADGPLRDQAARLLDEATSFRNRAAWRLPDGRTAFPKAFDWIFDPKWAPESYQVRVFRAAEEAAKRRAALPAPKKRVGRGK
jgi:hypothetical protein